MSGDDERYEWQLDIAGLGAAGQAKLAGASVLVSRCGGVGGAAALYLAAAGVGRLVLAHGGNLTRPDLNRQVLMADGHVGRPRIELIRRRILDLNPNIDVVAVGENIGEGNVDGLVRQADMVVDAAPLFAERYLMNRACVSQNKPMIDSAMYELEAQLTTIIPGKTPCLACLYPENPPAWKRKFPVLGAVAGMIGCLAAVEAVKVIAGFGEPLAGRLLQCDLRDMRFTTVAVGRRAGCAVCGGM